MWSVEGLACDLECGSNCVAARECLSLRIGLILAVQEELRVALKEEPHRALHRFPVRCLNSELLSEAGIAGSRLTMWCQRVAAATPAGTTSSPLAHPAMREREVPCAMRSRCSRSAPRAPRRPTSSSMSSLQYAPRRGRRTSPPRPDPASPSAVSGRPRPDGYRARAATRPASRPMRGAPGVPAAPAG